MFRTATLEHLHHVSPHLLAAHQRVRLRPPGANEQPPSDHCRPHTVQNRADQSRSPIETLVGKNIIKRAGKEATEGKSCWISGDEARL